MTPNPTPALEPLSPRARQIVDAAREILEEDGLDALSMRRIAKRLGIRAPSIYKHLPNKQAVEAAIISAVFEELATLFEAAVKGTHDPLGEFALAYRKYAQQNPHVYRLMTERPLPREQLVPGVEDRAAQPLLQATDFDMDTARAVWAFAHGMAILELYNRFPADADLDAAWQRGLNAFRAP